jgi:hypothetical protein
MREVNLKCIQYNVTENIRRMKINIIILQAEESCRSKEERKCKKVFLEVGGEIIMPFGLH